MPMFSIFIINSLLVGLVVLVHYETLSTLNRWLPRIQIRFRLRILAGVLGALVGHAAEIWLFGIATWLMVETGYWGTLEGNTSQTLMDCVYFSFTVYTTVGFGDIEPHGPIRFLTGVESLTGLVLVSWTASFLYLEMQRFWEGRNLPGN